jgi:hypothetical protein
MNDAKPAQRKCNRRGALLQDELIPQYRISASAAASDLKQSHGAQMKRKAIAIMAIMPDSLLTAVKWTEPGIDGCP